MSEPTHRCGPTPEQARSDMLGGEVTGTYPRCPACEERERKLLEGVILLRRSDMPPLTFEPIQ